MPPIKGQGLQRSGVVPPFFANDTLVFSKDSQMVYLCWLLMWFEAILGLKINLEKWELILIVGVALVEKLTIEFGMPLDASFGLVSVWDEVGERFNKRFSTWKRQYVSKGERLTLIWNILFGMSIYNMPLFSIPRKLRLKLEKIQRDFLCGGGTLEKKLLLIGWSIVCMDRSKEG